MSKSPAQSQSSSRRGKGALKALIGFLIVYFVLLTLVIAPLAALLDVLLGNSLVKFAMSAFCKGNSLVSTITFGAVSESPLCKLHDQLESALKQAESSNGTSWQKLEGKLNWQVRELLDCSNVSPQERADHECIPGLLATLEQQNGSPIPPDMDWMVPIWQQAGQRYHVPWELLAAVEATKTDFGAYNCWPSAQNVGGGLYRFSTQYWAQYAVHAGQGTDSNDGSCWTTDDPFKLTKDASKSRSKAPVQAANWFDAVDATFTEARELHAFGVDTPASSDTIAPLPGTSTGSQGTVQVPTIIQSPISFSQRRKNQTAAYSKLHYGIDSYKLTDPKVILEHYTEGSYQSTWSLFNDENGWENNAAADGTAAGPEAPQTSAHFVIDSDGAIHQLVPLNLMTRSVPGLNYTGIAIENVGNSDQEILDNSKELDASLQLTHYLMCKYNINLSDVIGHNEGKTSPYFKENDPWLRAQPMHQDWNKADMDVYRQKLQALGGCGASSTTGGSTSPDVSQWQYTGGSSNGCAASAGDGHVTYLPDFGSGSGGSFGNGISAGNLTVKGQPISQTQVDVVNTLLGEGSKLGANQTAMQAIIYAGIGETSLGADADAYTPNGAATSQSPRGYWGVLQGAVSEWPDAHDTAGFAQAFYTGKGPQGQTDFSTGAINWVKQGVTNPAEIAVRTEVPSIWPVDAYANEAGNGNAMAESQAIVAAYLQAGGGTTGAGTSSGGTSTISGSVTPESFAAAVLNGLGIPLNAANMQALMGWEAAEGGNWHNTASYNPINTTMDEPGDSVVNGAGVKAYTSWQQGLDATVATLKLSYYTRIVAALRGSDPIAVASAIGQSKWGTSASGAISAIRSQPQLSAAELAKLGDSSTSTVNSAGGPYAGPAQTDPISLALRRYAPGWDMSACYVAVVHDWYNAIVAHPPQGGGYGTMTSGTTSSILPDGSASIPEGAPAPVQKALEAGNSLIHLFYSQERRANMLTAVQDSYDCSGSTDFILWNAGLGGSGSLVNVGSNTAGDSTLLESYGDPGRGNWITVYANGGHAWIYVDGVVMDTAWYASVNPPVVPDPYPGDDPDNGGPASGPRWQPASIVPLQIAGDPAGFVQRHPPGL